MNVDFLKNILDNLNNTGFYDHVYCPYCNSNHVIKNGRYKGKQRFICKVCEKNFNSLTNSPIYMSHKPNKWPLFIECLIKGLSLRAAAAEIDVSYVTLFYWRHKLMSGLKNTENNLLTGNIEADDTFLAYSEKGNKKITDRMTKKKGNKCDIREDKKIFLLVATDHSNNLFIKASAEKDNCFNFIYKSLGEIISEKAVLCSNCNTFYKHFANLIGIKQHVRVSHYSRTSENNIDLARGHRKAIKIWLDKFHGVASKYLNNYLSLYNCLRKNNVNETEIGIRNFTEALKHVNIRENYRSIRALKLA